MLKAHVRRVLATAGVLASLGATMALLAPAASASPYCGGWVAAGATCSGTERTLTGVTGYGEQHAVCVWADSLSKACSSEPFQLASINYGSAAVRTPRIHNQGATANFVHAETL